MIRLFSALWIAFTVLMSPPALAKDAEKLDYTDKLYFTWAGISLGELTLTMQQEGKHYKMQTEGKTGGIVRLFSRHSSVTKVEGNFSEPDVYHPLSYRSDYIDNGDKRLIAIEYDEKGLPLKETIVPPREESRPLVLEEEKKGSVDILTGFFQMRDRLQWALQKQKKDFSVTVYDGKRLFRVDAIIEKPAAIVTLHDYDDKELPAIKLVLKRHPLAGYKEKELRKMKERNPVISLYIEPKRLVPFGLSFPIYGSKVEAWIRPQATKRK
jgi:hypothetical protein